MLTKQDLIAKNALPYNPEKAWSNLLSTKKEVLWRVFEVLDEEVLASVTQESILFQLFSLLSTRAKDHPRHRELRNLIQRQLYRLAGNQKFWLKVSGFVGFLYRLGQLALLLLGLYISYVLVAERETEIFEQLKDHFFLVTLAFLSIWQGFNTFGSARKRLVAPFACFYFRDKKILSVLLLLVIMASSALMLPLLWQSPLSMLCLLAGFLPLLVFSSYQLLLTSGHSSGDLSSYMFSHAIAVVLFIGTIPWLGLRVLNGNIFSISLLLVPLLGLRSLYLVYLEPQEKYWKRSIIQVEVSKLINAIHIVAFFIPFTVAFFAAVWSMMLHVMSDKLQEYALLYLLLFVVLEGGRYLSRWSIKRAQHNVLRRLKKEESYRYYLNVMYRVMHSRVRHKGKYEDKDLRILSVLLEFFATMSHRPDVVLRQKSIMSSFEDLEAGLAILECDYLLEDFSWLKYHYQGNWAYTVEHIDDKSVFEAHVTYVNALATSALLERQFHQLSDRWLQMFPMLSWKIFNHYLTDEQLVHQVLYEFSKD